MKWSYFLLLLAIIPSALWAQCAPVKDGEVIVMFDMNLSYTEVLGAEEAACKRGQKLLVYPGGIEAHKRLGKLNSDVYYLETVTFNQCRTRDKRCEETEKKLQVARDRLKEALQNAPTNKNPKIVFKELADQGTKVKSLILSGHDGGGYFGGTLGSIDKNTVMSSFIKAYEDTPSLTDELKSVYLWGCYTATFSEARSWRNGLPSVDLVAGFHGSGPSIGKEATRDYLQDLLIKEEKIRSEQKEEEIKRALNGLKNINYTLAGIYLEACDETEYYLSREKKITTDGPIVERNFNRAEDLLCTSGTFVEDFKVMEERFMKYHSGEIPIPENTSTGELREIYNFARSKTHCINELFPYSDLHPEKVGLLLFFKGVKENFSLVFKDDIIKAMEELHALPMSLQDALPGGLSFLGWLGESAKNSYQKALGGEKKLQDLKNYKSDFWLPTARNLEKASRQDIRENLTKMDKFLSHPAMDLNGMDDKVKHLRSLKTKMEIYLYELNHRCMSMLPWHERTNVLPSLWCH